MSSRRRTSQRLVTICRLLFCRDKHLWLGGDEGTSIDRMTRDWSGNFGSHKRFDLKDLLKLPGGTKEEIDIEGLDVNGGYLVRLIGSHSAKRKKAEDDKTPAENLERLSKVEAEGNRFTLARVPLDANSEPVAQQGGLTAARLQGDASGNLLTEALKSDRHVGRFVPRVLPDKSVEGIPSKDNGFDVEGLAVSGNRIFLRLARTCPPRLERCRRVATSPMRLTASSGWRAWERRGEPYLKHLLQLEGLGVHRPRYQRERCARPGGPHDGSRWSGVRLPVEGSARRRRGFDRSEKRPG